ncbi:MAG: CPBP family intramembrane metalloprotease [Chloroflexi bacterium AL-W]|nr:CPBP family intramembrane metalloprotease [Chloroflexi bacterium AL-N1]NOK66440.1 CPBP family intramembrane metalloprotease [Chloroflexi bacterium AL-N10]NOK71828.1 CPBP family intramembrane metalloprotease [Chloroflexi bacterium AL-N5]NOK81085.1 CPBP family intramembrane metalloprotease [Chloroflexi bacterium AL-W]NOK89358.1 CPBP family intramembrane metalloprotease [Chloroflexi bacterium AL-N15]
MLEERETKMKLAHTARTAGTTTEANLTTYVEAARQGKNQWWQYLVGLVVILVAWLIVGTAASVGVAFALTGQPDHTVLGPFGLFLFNMAGFPFFLAGTLLAVALIHRRHPRTLVTGRERIDWRRVGQGFVAWFIPMCLIGVLGQYLFYPNSFLFTTDLATFAFFVPLALVFTAIQTTSEELFYRGYIVQGASRIWTNRVFLALVSAGIFPVPHLLNPEVSAGGWLTIFLNYFLGTGLVWVVVSLIDGTTELAIGAHFANNIVAFLAFDAPGTAVSTPGLFTLSAFHPTFVALANLVIALMFLAIVYGVFKRKTLTRSPEPSAVSTATPVER